MEISNEFGQEQNIDNNMTFTDSDKFKETNLGMLEPKIPVDQQIQNDTVDEFEVKKYAI